MDLIERRAANGYLFYSFRHSVKAAVRSQKSGARRRERRITTGGRRLFWILTPDF
jgi:hypothetical protein